MLKIMINNLKDLWKARKEMIQMVFIHCPVCKSYRLSMDPSQEHSIGGHGEDIEESYGLKCDACGAKGVIQESWFAKKDVERYERA